MAQRKSPDAGKSGSTRNPGRTAGSQTGRPATKSTSTKPSARPAVKSGAKPAAKSAPGGRSTRPPAKGKGKSIVNQKERPWGLIITAIVIVLFAGGIVGAVIATRGSGSNSSASGGKGVHQVNANDPYRQPELPAAKKIAGVTYHVEGAHAHVTGTVKYDTSPPVGGDHNQYWANCNGQVYDHQLANENAVHMLEHGAIWITYNPKTLPSSELPKLESYVKGQDRIAMTPYAGLKTPISLQAWGYQLFLNSASDPRIAQFIATLKYNPKTTPENASCTDPYFTAAAAKASTPGHPFNG
jgi:hypothetical protein